MRIEAKQKGPHAIGILTLKYPLMHRFRKCPQGGFGPPQFGLNFRHRQIERGIGVPRQLTSDRGTHDEVANNDHSRKGEQRKSDLQVKRALGKHLF
jgi:hypothetical protein